MMAIEAAKTPLGAIAAGATIKEAAEQMDERGVSALVVLDEDRMVGLVTERDLVVRGLALGLPPGARIENVMTTEVLTLAARADARTALQLFQAREIHRLPLVEDGRVIAMLSLDDLLADLVSDISDDPVPARARARAWALSRSLVP